MGSDRKGTVLKAGGRAESLECKFTRDVLRCFVVHCPEELKIPDQLDWDRLAHVVLHYNLGSIFAYVLNSDSVPAGLRNSWNEWRMRCLFSNIRSLKTACKLFSTLEKAGISAVGLRGLTLSHFSYPDPGLRPMRDVDILIAPSDRHRIVDLMKSQGFIPAQILRTQFVYHIDGTIFEVHWSLLNIKRYRSAVDSEAFVKSRRKIPTPEGSVYCLSKEKELLGLVAHAFVHHELDRILQIVDIALYMMRADIDWKYITSWCRQAHMTNIFLFTLTFVNYFFNLHLERRLEVFGQSLPQGTSKTFESYIVRLFDRDTIFDHLRRKKNLFFVAEQPIVKLKQALRLIAPDEVRDLLQLLAKGELSRIGRCENGKKVVELEAPGT